MVIDISTRLRQLVLASLPLAAAGCADPDPGPSAVLSRLSDPACTPRTVSRSAPSGEKAPFVTVVYDPANPMLSDLHQACVTHGEHCGRLCSDLLVTASPPSFGGAGFYRCDVGCDASGNRVAVIQYSTAVPGRRPEGYGGAVCHAPGTNVGDWLARCAEMEGASVAAFRRLASELRHHGAPDDLVRRAEEAARDEVRHYKLMWRLARARGASPSFPKVETGPERSLLEVALENAQEGCVAETFAAALALWQAEAAAAEDIREAMRSIGPDELRHAQLAWDVHAWAGARLPDADVLTVSEHRRRAAESLCRAAEDPVDEDLAHATGLPRPAAAALLASRLYDELW